MLVTSDSTVASVWHSAHSSGRSSIARLPGVDVAAARIRPPRAALPRVLVAGEEHLMASRARAVDASGPRAFRRREAHREARAARLERGQPPRIAHVLGGAEMTRLA